MDWSEQGRRWGATFLGDGRVRFRLWAPSQPSVSVAFDDRDVEMRPVADGWFEADVAGLAHGTAYRYRLADGTCVADPASAAQRDDVFGPSLVIDQQRYRWRDDGWRGRPWHEAVIYEVHIGTFTPEGTFGGAIARLDGLKALGITAIEIMPVAQFCGRHGWGYDGVLHYAPHNAYGGVEDLKALVDAAHARGIMVFLDVVYNHFGPEGNFLPHYAPSFFHPERQTPWGAAIAYEQPAVRRYFIENALHWVGTFHFDGLRLDATGQMVDPNGRHILEDMATAIRHAFPDRHIHLITEDPAHPDLLRRDRDGRPRLYTAAWNHDLHHVLHVVATGEAAGYFAPFAAARWTALEAAITGRVRASSTGSGNLGPTEPLQPSMQVAFLQTHDQVGNRAFGERLAALTDERVLRQMTALLLLSPQVPLLFMGEELGDAGPFHFFMDHGTATSQDLHESRLREAENFGGVAAGVVATDLPDPRDPATFERSRPDWSRADHPEGRRQAELVRALIALRQAHVAPLVANSAGVDAEVIPTAPGVLAVDWRSGTTVLRLRANFLDCDCIAPGAPGTTIFATPGSSGDSGDLPAHGLLFALDRQPRKK
ncbi:malto-oligosyltrehalose trehalohydrolase [Mycoplana sp. MJR14]|uniref:malto-oligosyltrehalose trehalohydrolase n=1 Tax=Mycoplana sp. MJR14 TaxID=3032583 RepID=UPI0023D9DDFA|nr:malto-oligosyltrehalose trehalohydrolase [Mycoplana sp. MJR14]MDF1635522.1 malto-oligosyltrehalose trehalohydrolase [Mycoplana sp. MJR14]